MKGYIGITSHEWFNFLADKQYIGEINFWRKNTKNFKVLERGEPFFFLVKNKKGIDTERTILGMATFERFEVNSVNKAWDKYKQWNGDDSKDQFISRMYVMFNTTEENNEIGCIILSDFKVFSNPVVLSSLEINFQNSIVSGKGIREREVSIIQMQGFRSIDSVVKELSEVYNVGFTEDDDSFPEGKLMLKQHLVRERNSAVIKVAKKNFKEKHGKLICEVCCFDFNEYYGDIGEDYIEGHHTKPISQMIDNEETRVEDIALVCANCHRMLHRKRPWLDVHQLKELIN